MCACSLGLCTYFLQLKMWREREKGRDLDWTRLLGKTWFSWVVKVNSLSGGNLLVWYLEFCLYCLYSKDMIRLLGVHMKLRQHNKVHKTKKSIKTVSDESEKRMSNPDVWVKIAVLSILSAKMLQTAFCKILNNTAVHQAPVSQLQTAVQGLMYDRKEYIIV